MAVQLDEMTVKSPRIYPRLPESTSSSTSLQAYAVKLLHRTVPITPNIM